MENGFFTDAIELITKDCKDNVSENKSLKSCLAEISEERLENIIAIYEEIQYDEKERKTIDNILTKDDEINYINENIDKILNLEIEIFPEEIIRLINDFTKCDGYKEFAISELKGILENVFILRKLGIFYINIIDEVIKIRMPNEITYICKKILSRPNLEEQIKDKNTIVEIIQGFMNAYGIMSITEAYILISKFYKVFEPEMFNRFIFFTSNLMNYNYRADDIYIYNINLFEEEIPDLIQIHSKLKYHYYDIDEIKMLSRNEYYINHVQYKALKEFVQNINLPIKEIKEELLDLYIIIAQMDIEDAESFIDDKLNEINITQKNKQVLKKHVREIFEICPKWKLKGEIAENKNNNAKILKFQKK